MDILMNLRAPLTLEGDMQNGVRRIEHCLHERVARQSLTDGLGSARASAEKVICIEHSFRIYICTVAVSKQTDEPVGKCALCTKVVF